MIKETLKAFGEMTQEEFARLADNILMSPELSPEEFFTALAAISEKDEVLPFPIKLFAFVKNGKLTFLEPAPLPVRGNEICFGAQRVVINLIPELVASS